MTEIQQNRWDQLVRRSANIVGGGSQVNDTLNELFPIFDVENLPPELFLLGGTRLCMGGGNVSAVVAEAPGSGLFNPVGSGMIVTVTEFHVATNQAALIRWGMSFGTQFGGAISTQIYTDMRQLPPDLPVTVVSQVSQVALASGTNQSRVIPNQDLVVAPKNGLAVMPPGTGFEMGSATLNTSMSFGFYWRERVAEPAELNL